MADQCGRLKERDWKMGVRVSVDCNSTSFARRRLAIGTSIAFEFYIVLRRKFRYVWFGVAVGVILVNRSA